MPSDGHAGPTPWGRRLGGKMAFGGDWNPHQWPPDVVAEDIRLMREAGVTLVSVSPFSWAALEPEPGRYELDWLGHALDLLAEAGIGACVGTGTASPPPWLARIHPESLPQTADGVVLWPGARQHYCPSSSAYREAARSLVTRVATHVGEHPALVLWHVNNEYGAHTDACHCDVSAEHFRVWLAERYGDVQGLNDAWGTSFWSQRYSSFAEVWPPRRTPYIPNPAQQLDFRRFSSDALLDCFLLERDELRRLTPDVPVTTNFMGLFKPLDYWTWAANEDVVSDDAYPDPGDGDAHIRAALTDDLMRSLRHGQPWILMEQAPSAINWRDHNLPKPAGLMRLWSLMAVARGADGVMFFQWRASRRGAEKFHSAMVPHAGADTRTHREIVALGAELGRLAAVAGSGVEAAACMLLSWPSWWALELDSHPTADLRLEDQLMSPYRALWEANVTVDLRPPDADLSGYRLVVVPNLYLLSLDDASALARYCEGGGHLVVSFFSGIVDACDGVHAGGMAAPLAELIGVRLEEFWPLPRGARVALAAPDGVRLGHADLWGEVIRPDGAEVVARFASGDLAGHPAITRRAIGRGSVTYLATRPERALMARLMGEACEAAGVGPAFATGTPGVEAVRRGDVLFLLNHTDDVVVVDLPAAMSDLLDGGAVSRGALTLEPRAVRALVETGPG